MMNCMQHHVPVRVLDRRAGLADERERLTIPAKYCSRPFASFHSG